MIMKGVRNDKLAEHNGLKSQESVYVEKILDDSLDSFMFALHSLCGQKEKYLKADLVTVFGKLSVPFTECFEAHLRRKIRTSLKSQAGKAKLLNEIIEYFQPLQSNGSAQAFRQSLPSGVHHWLQIAGGELLNRYQSKTADSVFPIFERVVNSKPDLPHHKIIKAVKDEAERLKVPVSPSTLQRLYKNYFFKPKSVE